MDEKIASLKFYLGFRCFFRTHFVSRFSKIFSKNSPIYFTALKINWTTSVVAFVYNYYLFFDTSTF